MGRLAPQLGHAKRVVAPVGRRSEGVGLPRIALYEEEASRFLKALERPDDRTVAELAAGELEPDLDGLIAGGNWALITRHGRLDAMQHLDGLGSDGGGWQELRPHAVTRRFLGHDCLFCSYEDLVRMKRAASRPQDRIDIENLKAARAEG